jgi:hypothetical protein
MELEAALHALGHEGTLAVRFSDAQGRERRAKSLRELSGASGVIVVEADTATLVTSEAIFAAAPARCACGDDALAPIGEVYKRTHGGAAPARLLEARGLGRALRGRCRGCGARLDRASVRSSVEAPFAHFAAFLRGDSASRVGELARATGPGYRTVPGI